MKLSFEFFGIDESTFLGKRNRTRAAAAAGIAAVERIDLTL